MTDSELSPQPPAERTPSRLDVACERFMHDMAKLSPTMATAVGITEFDDQLQDFSPAYYDAVADRTARMLRELSDIEAHADTDPDLAFDDTDRVTAAVMRDRLGRDLALHEAGEDVRELNTIESPIQHIRDSFTLMDSSSARGRAAIASRMAKIPLALAGYKESLLLAAKRGHVAAKRTIALAAQQARDLSGDNTLLATYCPGDDNADNADNADIVADAAAAFGAFADWLDRDLAPQAPDEVGVGRERYERFIGQFVGFDVDLDAAYEWGTHRLAAIVDEQQRIATSLYGPSVTVAEAMDRLNRDEKYTIHGTDNLQSWMHERAEEAITNLDGVHFDIPQPVKTIECVIDPAGTGGIYYTPPSDDFSRPGRMVWSVPPQEDTFHMWQELTTVYHEGVPGHHLQCGIAAFNSDRLNMWRRLGCWNSGHGEGWALYAEALMDRLGYHEDPATRMGMLDAQRLRAARVVLDIGVHLNKKTDDSPSGRWDPDYAWSFLRKHCFMAESNLRFEFERYLSWPGQAPSYALGQRKWEQMRDDALARGMSLKQFHSVALAQGSIPLSILADVVATA